MTDETDVVIERTLEAPRERVWRAFADPDDFARWFGGTAMAVARDSLELDVRTGGRASYRMEEHDREATHFADTRFVLVEEPSLIVAEESFDMGAGIGHALLRTRIELHELGPRRTLLRILQGPHGDMAGPAAESWRGALDMLEALVADAAAPGTG